MIPAVIYHHEDYKGHLDEHKLLNPALLLSEKVILASDLAQLFELRNSLTSHPNPAPLQVTELCDENHFNQDYYTIFNRHIKQPEQEERKNHNGEGRLSDDAWHIKLLEVNSCLSALNIFTAGQMNYGPAPNVLELYKTNSYFGREVSDKNLVSVFKKILFNHDVIPFMPAGIELLDSVTLDSTPEPDIPCGFTSSRPFMSIPCIDNLIDAFRYIFMSCSMELSAELNSLIGEASLTLRNKTYYNDIIDDIEESLEKIYSAGVKLTQMLFGANRRMVEKNECPRDFYAYSLRLSTAEKLIEDYILLKMINPEVEDSIFEMFYQINPQTCYLSIIISHLTIDETRKLILKK